MPMASDSEEDALVAGAAGAAREWTSPKKVFPRESTSTSSNSSANDSARNAAWKVQGQVGQLQRLGQPYFLPLGDRAGWHFLWLLLSLVLCVAGVTLLLLTGMLRLAFAVAPSMAGNILSGPDGMVRDLWGGIGGAVIMALAVAGAASFYGFRRELQGRWAQWLLLGFIMLVLLSVNGINTGIGFVANYMTQALVEKKEEETYRWLHIYLSCFVFALPVISAQGYVKEKLGILWREWLSIQLVEGWMSHRAYYVLNPNDEQATVDGVDNPDQRISQDAQTFTAMTLQFLLGAIDSLMMFCLNILVLWNINHTLTISLLLWSIVMTSLTCFFGKNLIEVSKVQLRLEADFRYALVHVRDNAECIAFYGGEVAQKNELRSRLGCVVENYVKIILWRVAMGVLRRVYTYGAVFVPYFVMAPFILSGKLTFGDFQQANFTFRMVEDALSFIPDNITEIAPWAAGIARLEGFQTAVSEVASSGKGASPSPPLSDCRDVTVRDAELQTPQGQMLVSGLTFSVGQGERLLVVGPSGCGKTSMLRMICGLWQPSAGLVATPPVGELMFIPQKPYMILGSLREQLSFPKDAGYFTDEQFRWAMEIAQLGHFLSRYPDLGVKQDWARLLSLGEQQRLSWARVLLNNPNFVVLDEATSGLDVRTEQKLYRMLMERGTSFISVGHRPTLTEFHSMVLELKGAPTGSWKLVPAASYDFQAGASSASAVLRDDGYKVQGIGSAAGFEARPL